MTRDTFSRYIFSSNEFLDWSHFILLVSHLNYLLPLIPDRSDSFATTYVCHPIAVLIVSCIVSSVSESRSAAGVLTCSWRAVPSGVEAASRSSAGTPRTRCRPSPRRSQGWARYRAGVGPEGGRDGPEESCTSTPRKWYGMRCRLCRRRRRFDAARTRRNPYWFLRGKRRAPARPRGWTGVGSRPEREKEEEGGRKRVGGWTYLAAYSCLAFTANCSVHDNIRCDFYNWQIKVRIQWLLNENYEYESLGFCFKLFWEIYSIIISKLR